MKLILGMIAISALLSPSAATAEDVGAIAAPPTEHRLSPQQIDAVLAEAAARREASEQRAPAGQITAELPSQPPIFGEVGISIGTGGYRDVFGSALYPLGEDGVAAIHLNFVDGGRRRSSH